MTQLNYLPHINQFLWAINITRERLDSQSKVAIDARLLKLLLRTMVKCAPFSEEFYLKTYPDIAQAYNAGQLKDLKEHYVEQGYFEGRTGAPGDVDENYYKSRYPDVTQAMSEGNVKSGAQHYQQTGYSEGRTPCEAFVPDVDLWSAALRDDARRALRE
jgi:hypothetical protein